MAEVKISNVRKAYGDFDVMHGIDIDVAAGEFVVLVGPSGCGKSTLLRMIAGLERISGGTISIAGKVVNDLQPRERDIAMVFQNYALYPHMTVAENMSFSLRLQRLGKEEIRAGVARAAEILDLSKLLDRYPRQLSGGQRQRVAMGRAIVRNPRVFLFDEPLSNLDAELRVSMRAQIKELHQRLGTTMIYVTHDQIEAMTMADKIVVMRNGRVEQMGPPLDLYDRPANRFVAGFLGSPSMNFLAGNLQRGAFVPQSGQAVSLPDGYADMDGRKVLLGVRPEHVQIVDRAQPGVIPADVALIEPTGLDTLVVVRNTRDEITASYRGRAAVRVGETIGLALDPAHLHVFDQSSLSRIEPAGGNGDIE